MIRFIIWDAGGTLFDTYPAVTHACELALGEFGESAPSVWVMNLCKKTTSHGIRTLAHTFQLDEDVFARHFRRTYDDIGPEYQPPFPGVVDICRYICDFGGQNFIVTHRGRASLMALLQTHDMTQYFVDIITKDDAYPRKPDPASMLALINRYHLDPKQGLTVGDRDLDIQAGDAAGLRTCYLGEVPISSHADLKITIFDDLFQWIKAENGIGVDV